MTKRQLVMTKWLCNSILIVGHDQTSVSHDQTSVGHDQTTVGHDQTTVGHAQMTDGHDQMTVGHEQTTVGHDQTTVGHDKTTVGHNQTQSLSLLLNHHNPLSFDWMSMHGPFVFVFVLNGFAGSYSDTNKLYNFQNLKSGLIPSLHDVVTKWAYRWQNKPIGGKMIVVICLNGLAWSFIDQYKMNVFGIFKIGYQKHLIPGLYPLWWNEPLGDEMNL